MRILQVDGKTRLRPLELSDAAKLYPLVEANRNYLREWMSWVDSTHSEKPIVAFIKRTLKERDDGIAFEYMIEYELEPCGVTGLTRINKANRSGMLGYWLRKEFQGQGIITKSCRTLLGFGFADLNLNRITLAAGVGNFRSRAVAERLGFAYEGTLREVEWMNDRFIDHAFYSLLKREWEQQSTFNS